MQKSSRNFTQAVLATEQNICRMLLSFFFWSSCITPTRFNKVFNERTYTNFSKHLIEFLKKSSSAKNSSIIKVTASFKFYNFIYPGPFVSCLQRFVPWKLNHKHLKEKKALPLDRLMLYISVQSMSGQMSEFLSPGVIKIFHNCYWRIIARAICCCFALHLNKNAGKRAKV